MFSKYIFWDRQNVDFEKDKEYVILKVLQFGDIQDWKNLEKLYWKKQIIEVLKQKWYMLRPKTLALAEVVWDTKFNFKLSKNVLQLWYSNRFQSKMNIK